MAISKTIDVNTIDLDRDGINDHITFRVTQTEEQSFSVRTFVDTSKDGFSTLNSDITKIFDIDTVPHWLLSNLKFEANKLVLLGQDNTSKPIAVDQLIPEMKTAISSTDPLDPLNSANPFNKRNVDHEIAEKAGVLGAQ